MTQVSKAVTMHGRTHRYNGDEAGFFAFLGSLVAQHGPDGAMVVSDATADSAPESTPPTPRSAPAPRLAPESAPAVSLAGPAVPQSNPPSSPRSAPPILAGVSEADKLRALADREAAIKAGFSLKETLYDIGTAVNSVGVANARKSRAEYDARPEADVALASLIKRVADERRSDRHVNLADLRMSPTGKLTAPYKDGRAEVWLTEDALCQLAQKAGMGSGDFLLRAWPELRSFNVNEWMARIGQREEDARKAVMGTRTAPPESTGVKLRVRDARDGQREVFAVTSQSYTPFDIDKIAEAIKLASPGGKADIKYDGRRARIDLIWHSDVAPERYVCGEAFKAGVSIRTDDTGGGSVRGGGVAYFNRCLNLIVIDRAAKETIRIRHMGDVRELARRFREGFRDAMASIEHFRLAWGAAHEAPILETAESGGEDLTGKRLSEVIPGFFRGMIERELVTIPGRREETIEKLVKAWDWDESAAKHHHNGINRAALVNAVTRAAHAELDLDPWTVSEIERDAVALVYSKRPLPWIGSKK